MTKINCTKKILKRSGFHFVGIASLGAKFTQLERGFNLLRTDYPQNFQ